jgi:hypothetical protein
MILTSHHQAPAGEKEKNLEPEGHEETAPETGVNTSGSKLGGSPTGRATVCECGAGERCETSTLPIQNVETARLSTPVSCQFNKEKLPSHTVDGWQ